MKCDMPLLILLAAGAGAIAFVQCHRIDTQASPQALLTAAADAQHEITRVPARFDRMSDTEEIAIGSEIASKPDEFRGVDRDAQQGAAAQAYLQAVGLRVATHVRRKLPWTFHYIPNPGFVNAFALPGGHIYVGEGLLRLMRSEDALPGVLGHEIEHVDLRDCAERAQAEAHLRKLGSLADLAGLPLDI